MRVRELTVSDMTAQKASATARAARLKTTDLLCHVWLGVDLEEPAEGEEDFSAACVAYRTSGGDDADGCVDEEAQDSVLAED